MRYHQFSPDERYRISELRLRGINTAAIATHLGRHRSSVCREIARNQCNDGCYRPEKAITRTRRRRRESRRKWQFSDGQLRMISALLRLDWSPEQIAGWLRVCGIFRISHATIYRFVWYDRTYGGCLHRHLRQSGKKWRKRYGSSDSRGLLPGKRHISERPASAQSRSRVGHWEIDTVMGGDDPHCIVTMVERKTRYTLIGKLSSRTSAELNRRVVGLVNRQERKVRTITADNGTEFHGYPSIESVTGTTFFFADPYHSWERGLSENTNGLIRQYLPKRVSMANLTQAECKRIATKLNRRPRKSLGYRTPEQCYGVG
jgi:IS30 family transposase